MNPSLRKKTPEPTKPMTFNIYLRQWNEIDTIIRDQKAKAPTPEEVEEISKSQLLREIIDRFLNA